MKAPTPDRKPQPVQQLPEGLRAHLDAPDGPLAKGLQLLFFSKREEIHALLRATTYGAKTAILETQAQLAQAGFSAIFYPGMQAYLEPILYITSKTNEPAVE